MTSVPPPFKVVFSKNISDQIQNLVWDKDYPGCIPSVGDYVSLKGFTFRVTGVVWDVDSSPVVKISGEPMDIPSAFDF